VLRILVRSILDTSHCYSYLFVKAFVRVEFLSQKTSHNQSQPVFCGLYIFKSVLDRRPDRGHQSISVYIICDPDRSWSGPVPVFFRSYGLDLQTLVESHLFFSPATPVQPIVATAATGKKAKSKKGKNPAAPPSTPRTNQPAPASEPLSVRSIASEAAFEKCSVTLQVPDAQAGHLIGRAGSGLQQVHDYSRAKVLVAAATGLSDLRAVTIRGSAQEVGDALVAVGKRIACRRVRNPRDKKKKKRTGAPLPPLATAPTSSLPLPDSTTPYIPTVSRPPPTSVQPAPQVWISPPELNRSRQPITSAKHPLPPSSPMQLSTPSAPSSALPPGTPMDVDTLRTITRTKEILASRALRLAEASAATTYTLPPATVISRASSDGTSSARGQERSGLQTARRGRPFHGH
jgi:hypothetical protein